MMAGIERKGAHKITKRNNDIFRLIAKLQLLCCQGWMVVKWKCCMMGCCNTWFESLLDGEREGEKSRDNMNVLIAVQRGKGGSIISTVAPLAEKL